MNEHQVRTAAPQFPPAFDRLVTDYAAVLRDGKLTIHEVLTLFTRACLGIIALLTEHGRPLTAADRRLLFSSSVDQFYTTLIAPLDLPMIPDFLEPLVDKALGSMFDRTALSLYDAVAATLEKLDPLIPVPTGSPVVLAPGSTMNSVALLTACVAPY